jgi:hypothetical protein
MEMAEFWVIKLQFYFSLSAGILLGDDNNL